MKDNKYSAAMPLGAMVILAFGLLYWVNRVAVDLAIAELFGALFVGIKILFFAGSLLGLAWCGIELHRRSRVTVIKPSKHGPAQAAIHRGELVQLTSAQQQLDPMQQLQMLKSVMQLQGQMATYARREVSEVQPQHDEPQKQIGAPPVDAIHLTDDYAVPADDLLSGRKLIVGLSGSGKSNTVGAYCEELGRLEAPLVLADTENEYEPLCNPRWFPRGELVDARLVTSDNAYQFGGYVLQDLKQIVLNLQSYEMEEAALVMIGIIQGMRDWQEERDVRIPSEFILEEAVTWLPQNIKESPLYGSQVLNSLQGTFFNDMVRKGRKRGLGLTVVCQKIAEIDKRALQADAKILHYQNEGPDLERYEKMGIAKEETLSLQKGDAFLYTSHVSKRRVHIRKRYSEHGANTPGLDNLHRYQRTRNLPENASERDSEPWRTSEPSNVVRLQFGAPLEPVRESSDGPQNTAKSAQRDIPPELRTEIITRYRGGDGRKKIQSELHIAGDQFWQLREICDAVDRERETERA